MLDLSVAFVQCRPQILDNLTGLFPLGLSTSWLCLRLVASLCALQGFDLATFGSSSSAFTALGTCSSMPLSCTSSSCELHVTAEASELHMHSQTALQPALTLSLSASEHVQLVQQVLSQICTPSPLCAALSAHTAEECQLHACLHAYLTQGW